MTAISPPALFAGSPWLLPLALPLLLGVWASFGRTRPRALIAAGAAGLVWLAAAGPADHPARLGVRLAHRDCSVPARASRRWAGARCATRSPA